MHSALILTSLTAALCVQLAQATEKTPSQPLAVSPPSAVHSHNPPPPYPAEAKQQRLEGRVMLRAHILANGKPAEVRVDNSSGHEVLDKAALEEVRDHWTFEPAKRGNQPVDVWVRVPIDFKLKRDATDKSAIYRVKIKAHVLPDGKADEVRVIQSSGSPVLDKAAQETIRTRWKFVPAKRGNQPVDSWVIVPVDFKLTK